MMGAHKIILSCALVTLLLVTGMNLSFATDKKEPPLLVTGTIKVSAEELLDVAAKMPDLLIIDARIPEDRKQGYIEGSVSLPDVDTDCVTLAKVIPKKSTPVLFYCNGVKCGRSVKSSRIAIKCGYSHVYWFRGGFEEWKAKNYPFIKD